MTDADGTGQRPASRSGRLVGAVLGDRHAVAIFLGALVCFGAWWRIGFFITDSTTVANALVNVAEGRLAIVETPYSLTLGSQPGLVRVGDQLFGRNYGHVLLSLPVLWLLEAVSLVADPSVVIAGAWSLLVVGFARQLAVLTGRDRLGTVGSGIALVCFAGNLLTARSLTDGQSPWAATSSALPNGPLELVALQVTTMLAGAVAAATTYKLLSRFHGRRVGVAAGVTLVLATPVGFWASIPKRHVVTAAAAIVCLYCFAVSRESPARWYRAGAYASLGLLTTLHAFEAFFLFVVLLPVDLLTAPSNDRRTVGVLGVVFFVALVPFFVVNTLIGGNPIEPPRMLSGVWGANVDVDPGSTADPSGTGGTTGGGDTGGGSGGESTPEADGAGGDAGENSGSGGGERAREDPGDDGDSLPLPLGLAAVLLAKAVDQLTRILGFVTDSAIRGLAAVSEPQRLYHTFVRSGRIPGVSYAANNFETVELALLEAFPLVAGLLWIPVAALGRVRDGIATSAFGTPKRQTDILAAGFAVVFTVVYMPRLPLQSQITLRYILPVIPLAVYGLARQSVLRRPIEATPRWLVGSYLLAVGVGSVLTVAAIGGLGLAVGEAVQLHALSGLAAGAVTAVCVVTWWGHEKPRVLAVGLAFPAGVTTAFLVLSSLAYFDYGIHALGLAGELAGVLPL